MKGAVSEEEIKQLNHLYRRIVKQNEPEETDVYSELKALPDIDVSVICYAGAEGTAAVGDIAKALRVPDSTLTSSINRLVKKGLVSRATNQMDRRSYEIRATDEGERLRQGHLALEQERLESILSRLDTHEERDMLFYLLTKMAGPERRSSG